MFSWKIYKSAPKRNCSKLYEYGPWKWLWCSWSYALIDVWRRLSCSRCIYGEAAWMAHDHVWRYHSSFYMRGVAMRWQIYSTYRSWTCTKAVILKLPFKLIEKWRTAECDVMWSHSTQTKSKILWCHIHWIPS